MTDKHPCKGDFLDKFVQPAILAALCDGPAYGLLLLERLGGSPGEVANIAGFYRSLKVYLDHVQRVSSAASLACDKTRSYSCDLEA